MLINTLTMKAYRNRLKKKRKVTMADFKKADGEIRRDVFIEVKRMIDNLPPQKKKIIKLEREFLRKKEKTKLTEKIIKEFGENFVHSSFSLEEIGTLLGLSRERVRQIEEYALRKIRNPETSRIVSEYKCSKNTTSAA